MKFARKYPTWAAVALFLVIAFIALFLRLRGLQDESVWVDEFLTLPQDTSLSYSEYLRLNRHRAPDNVPLYHLYVLTLAKLGLAPFQMRLLGIGLSLFGLFLVFRIGRALAGTRAGLVAALLYAVSPYFIFQAQALRPYNLMIILTCAATYALVRYMYDKRIRWLVLNTFVNALLLGTHLTSAMTLIPFTLAMAATEWSRPLRFASWVTVNLALALSAFAYVTIPPQDPYYAPPTLWSIVNNLLLDDFVGHNPEINVAPDRGLWPLLSAHGLDWILPTTAALAAAVYMLSLIYGIAGWVRVGERAKGRTLLLLVALASVPLFFQTLFSFVREPMMLPRYAAYSSLGLFLLAGGLFTALPRKLGYGILCALFAAYSAHVGVYVSSDSRTEWVRVVRILKEHAQPRDLVAVTPRPDSPFPAFLSIGVLRYNMQQAGFNHAIGYFYDDDRAADYARYYLEKEQAGGRTAWMLIHHSYSTNRSLAFEGALESAGLTFTAELMGAHEGLTLYRVEIGNSAVNPPQLGLAEDECRPILEELQSLGVELDSESDSCEMLSRVFNGDRWTVDSPVFHATLAMRLMDADLDLAERVARAAVERAPDVAATHFALGSIRTLKGQHKEAAESYRRCLQAPPDYYPHFMEGYLRSLIAEDMTAAAAQAERLARAEAFLPEPVRRFFSLPNAPHLCQLP